MGNRTARDTGILGTGVEAVGDEEKMSEYGIRIVMQGALAAAEARGYRRGVERMAEIVAEYEGVFFAERCLTEAMEQTSDTNSPHPENGTGLKSET
jgi:hypothetical protein